MFSSWAINHFHITVTPGSYSISSSSCWLLKPVLQQISSEDAKPENSRCSGVVGLRCLFPSTYTGYWKRHIIEVTHRKYWYSIQKRALENRKFRCYSGWHGLVPFLVVTMDTVVGTFVTFRTRSFHQQHDSSLAKCYVSCPLLWDSIWIIYTAEETHFQAWQRILEN